MKPFPNRVKTLLAMKKLKRQYETDTYTCGGILTCPLCKVSGYKDSNYIRPDEENACKKCPWVVMTGHICCSMDVEGYSGQTYELRIERLNKWIEAYEKNIKDIPK